MQFKRQTLMRLVDKAITDHRASFDAEQTKDLQKYERDFREWLRAQGPRWRKFANQIYDCLTEKVAITEDMIPRVLDGYRNRDIATFDQGEYKANTYQPPNHLLALKTFLEVCEGDMVSSNDLRDFDLVKLMKAQVQGSEVEDDD